MHQCLLLGNYYQKLQQELFTAIHLLTSLCKYLLPKTIAFVIQWIFLGGILTFKESSSYHQKLLHESTSVLLLRSYYQKLLQERCICIYFQAATTKNYCKKDVLVFTFRQLLQKLLQEFSTAIYLHNLGSSFSQFLSSYYQKILQEFLTAIYLLTSLRQFLLTVSKQLLPKSIAGFLYCYTYITRQLLPKLLQEFFTNIYYLLTSLSSFSQFLSSYYQKLLHL